MERLRTDKDGNLYNGGVYTADGFIPKKIVRAVSIGNPIVVSLRFQCTDCAVFDEIRARCPEDANAYTSIDATPMDWYERQQKGRQLRHAEIIDFFKII